MTKQIITTSKAPKPIGPYSQAIKTGGFLFISGQVAIDPETNEFINGNITDETKRVMENLFAILKEAKLTFEHIVKTTIFLSDMSLFTSVNDVYGSFFKADFPARETIAVKGLPKNANVEISMIAAITL